MNSGDGDKKQLPVVLPPVPDELLSSWIARHASVLQCLAAGDAAPCRSRTHVP